MESLQHRNHLSKRALFILIAWFAIVGCTKRWQNPLSWDAFGYHLYLPAAFIWEDVPLRDIDRVEATRSHYQSSGTLYQVFQTENGSRLVKYTMGLAMLEAPFFLTAHVLAPVTGYPADGFSLPYQAAFLVMHFVYFFIGLLFLRKALLKLFPDAVVALLLLVVALGTNVYVMALLTGGSTPVHTTAFALVSALLYVTILLHERPTTKRAAAAGMLSALLVLLRPSDAVVLLVPILWGVDGIRSLLSKMKRMLTVHRRHLLTAAVTAILLLLPQLLYWKSVTGSWLVYGYSNNAGEGFDFLNPHLPEVLFSFRKGWLVYTPLMAVALAGFFTLSRRRPGVFLPVFVFFLVNVYVVSSWSCWWYAGCFSQRALVDGYPLLLLPLGALTEAVWEGGRGRKTAFLLVLGGLTALNLFQSWQYSAGIIDGSRMTGKYYARVFGRLHAGPEDRKLLLIARSTGEQVTFADEQDYRHRTLFTQDFNEPDPRYAYQYKSGMQEEGAMCLQMDSTFIYTPKLEAPYATITRKDHAWIRTTFWYNPLDSMESTLLSLVVAFDHNGELYEYKAVDAGLQPGDHPVIGKWNKFTFDYLTPEVRSENDALNIYLWLRGKKSAYIDDVKVEVFERM